MNPREIFHGTHTDINHELIAEAKWVKAFRGSSHVALGAIDNRVPCDNIKRKTGTKDLRRTMRTGFRP